MINWTLRKKRAILGSIMFWSFVALVYQFHFFSQVFFQYNQWYIAMGMLLGLYWYMWIPSVVLIGLTYFLLMRVYKDENNENKVLKLYPKNWWIKRIINMIFKTSKRVMLDKDKETPISGFRYVME